MAFLSPHLSHAADLDLDLNLIWPQILSRDISDWMIIDARPKKNWEAGHIPGAMPFNWKDYTRTDEKGIAYRILPPAQLASMLEKMGINRQSRVVVYGDSESSWGGEGWIAWMFAWLGHEGPIRLLNGGIQAWINTNYPINDETDAVQHKRTVYEYKLNHSIIISEKEIIEKPGLYQFVDTRSLFEWFMGKRIPGAIHISWKDFFTGKPPHPLSPSATEELLSRNGIDTTKPVVYYCRGGIRSAYAWMVHQLAGLPAAVNFEGGTAAWRHKSP